MWNIHDRWAVFISGRGSNLQALLDLTEAPPVSLVVSSSSSAPGIQKAQRAGISTLILEKKVNWEELNTKLQERRIQKIFLLGFMRILPSEFVQEWAGKILNIHPSLLPQFVGLQALERSFEAQGDVGVTVHEVIPQLDAGPPLLQRKVLDLKARSELDYKACALRVVFTEHQMARESFLR